MTETLTKILSDLSNLKPEYEGKFKMLLDECQHFAPQFAQFTDIEEAVSLLCSTPMFVAAYNDNVRTSMESIILEYIFA